MLILVLSNKIKLSHFRFSFVVLGQKKKPNAKHNNTVTKTSVNKTDGLQLIGVKLAITCNLFLIMQQFTVINLFLLHICCYLHIQKFTFKIYNQDTTSW